MSGMNGSILSRQPIVVPNIPATIKVEPNTGNMVSAPYLNMPTVARPNVSQAVASLQNPSMLVSHEMSTSVDGVQEVKPVVSCMSLPMRPMGLENVKILNEISQARQMMNSASLTGTSSVGLPSMGLTPVAMHMSNMICSGMASSIPTTQNIFSAGQPGIPSMAGLGSMAGSAPVIQNKAAGSVNSASSNMSGNANSGLSQPLGSNLQSGETTSQSVPGISRGIVSSPQMGQNGIGMNQTMNGLGSSTMPPGNNQMILNPSMPHVALAQPGTQSIGTHNNVVANMPLAQQTSNAINSGQSKYVKVWEGNLSGQRQGQPVFITRLEGYRSATAPENLAENWPSTIQIVRLISQDHMNNKQYVGKADFLVFQAMNSHGFLGQLQEKKLCVVIQLVSRTLLLSVSDKACRLIGMHFPGDMVVFKLQQMPNQQQQMPPQQQQNNQLQQQQQQTPQQHMVGSAAINQGFVQGPARSQLVPPQGQQQGTPQVAPNMQGPGSGFMS